MKRSGVRSNYPLQTRTSMDVPVRQYLACLLSVGVTITSAQHLSAQFQMPTDNKSYTQVGHVDVSSVKPEAPELKKLSVPAAQVREVATALNMRYRDSAEVRISPDVRNESLIVMAPKSMHGAIAQQVADIMTARVARNTATAVKGPMLFDLAHIGWRQFERALQAADGGGTPVTTSRNGQNATYQLMSENLQGTKVHVNRQANSIRIEAPPAASLAWQKLIRALDQQPTRQHPSMQLVRMENAEQAPIQRAVFLLKTLSAKPSQAVRKKESPTRFRLPNGSVPARWWPWR